MCVPECNYHLIKSPEQFYGPACKSSDLLCPYTQFGLCKCYFIIFGNGKGTCINSKCNCQDNYSEEDCSKMTCSNPLKNNECRRTETSAECSGNGNCDCGKCVCNPGYMGTYCQNVKLPSVRCSDVEKCMLAYFAGTETTACNKPFTVVDKLDEPKSYFTPICEEIYQNCVREFMIKINQDGTTIESITVKKLIPHTGDKFMFENASKVLILQRRFGCTRNNSWGNIVLFVIVCVIYHYYKKRSVQMNEVERERRRWVLNSKGRYVVNSEAQD
ncbi:Tenascin-X [Thelohanellus kitauei]|uniref:Tenascin-X n=1 Tax=Thelohanellus kitauei TaxID=669202 RepID=A0A0C2JAQ7_THEKT|nr:Tenascin-X [Thelohanellus kitauei]